MRPCPNPACPEPTNVKMSHYPVFRVECEGCGMSGPMAIAKVGPETKAQAAKLWDAMPRQAETDFFANRAMPTQVPHHRRVVCAAIRASDGEVITGIRHYDALMHRQLEQRTDGAKFCHLLDNDQGFVDQHGIWMDRLEAYEVAKAAGQLVYPEACGEGLDGPKLYSEGLY